MDILEELDPIICSTLLNLSLNTTLLFRCWTMDILEELDPIICSTLLNLSLNTTLLFRCWTY